jgi:hypothetical protein
MILVDYCEITTPIAQDQGRGRLALAGKTPGGAAGQMGQVSRRQAAFQNIHS